jgi:hypothetical protein
MKISMLPYHQVTRRCDHLEDVVVAHCRSAKNGNSKMNMFAKYDFLAQGDRSLQ